MKKISLVMACLIALSSPASAWDWSVDTRITAIETSYVPDGVVFWTETGSTSCPAGTLFGWNPTSTDKDNKIANAQAALSILTTALVSGKKIRLFGLNNCTIEHIHLLAAS